MSVGPRSENSCAVGKPREPLIPLIKEYLGFLKGLLKGIYRGSIRELRNMA